MSDASNPYAVTTLELGKPVKVPDDTSRLVRWMILIALPLLLIGAASSLIDIESIVASGPVMLIYGLILMFLTRGQNQRLFRWFAWTCCAFPIFVFLIIYLLEWSPGDAQIPISALCCVFACLVFAGIVRSFALATHPLALLRDDVTLKVGDDDSSRSLDDVSSATLPAKAP